MAAPSGSVTSVIEEAIDIDTRSFPVDPTNSDQVGDWDGPDGAYWATYHREYERLLGVFDSTLLTAGAVGPADRCLDIGCGTGATTRALAARATEGSALGLDLSGPMLDVAREAARRAGVPNVGYVQGDAQVHLFDPASFDVAVSRMGCMFFGDPVKAFANVGRALRPGGRLALAVWQERTANHWVLAIDEALGEPPVEAPGDQAAAYAPGPWSFADPRLVESVLQQAGLVDITVEPLDIPLAFGSVEVAEAFLATWMDDDLDDDGRARAKTALRALLEQHLTGDGVLLSSATWLVKAHRPEE